MCKQRSVNTVEWEEEEEEEKRESIGENHHYIELFHVSDADRRVRPTKAIKANVITTKLWNLK